MEGWITSSAGHWLQVKFLLLHGKEYILNLSWDNVGFVHQQTVRATLAPCNCTNFSNDFCAGKVSVIMLVSLSLFASYAQLFLFLLFYYYPFLFLFSSHIITTPLLSISPFIFSTHDSHWPEEKQNCYSFVMLATTSTTSEMDPPSSQRPSYLVPQDQLLCLVHSFLILNQNLRATLVPTVIKERLWSTTTNDVLFESVQVPLPQPVLRTETTHRVRCRDWQWIRIWSNRNPL